jgi:hypothetical protein
MPPPNNSKNSVQVSKPGDKVPIVKPTLKPGEAADVAAVTVERPWVPPDEAIWENFAANGEPWLSGLGSAVLHGLMLLIILTGVLWMFSGGTPVEPELESVEVGDGIPGGGGGSTEGVVPGEIGNLTRPDETKSLEPDKKDLKDLPTEDPTVKKDNAPTIDDDATDFVAKIQNKTPKALGPILKDALVGLAGIGKGGTGSGGGEGSGRGTGRGDGVGPGTGGTRRGARVLRWELEFRFNSAAGYLQQLDALGCYLGFPDKTGKLLFIRNLKERPAKPVYEDIKKMNRVYFVDQRADSNDGIAEELKLDLIPAAIVAAMPYAMEEQLVDAETKFRGRKEEDIKRTRFLVTFSGGKASFKVVEQEPKPGRK